MVHTNLHTNLHRMFRCNIELEIFLENSTKTHNPFVITKSQFKSYENNAFFQLNCIPHSINKCLTVITTYYTKNPIFIRKLIIDALIGILYESRHLKCLSHSASIGWSNSWGDNFNCLKWDKNWNVYCLRL